MLYKSYNINYLKWRPSWVLIRDFWRDFWPREKWPSRHRGVTLKGVTRGSFWRGLLMFSLSRGSLRRLISRLEETLNILSFGRFESEWRKRIWRARLGMPRGRRICLVCWMSQGFRIDRIERRKTIRFWDSWLTGSSERMSFMLMIRFSSKVLLWRTKTSHFRLSNKSPISSIWPSWFLVIRSSRRLVVKMDRKLSRELII